MDYAKIGYHFGLLNRRSQAYITYACKPWRLSYSEYVVLHALYSRDGCSQDELVKGLTADNGLVARTTKTLAEKGFILRQQDAVDKRLRRLYVTAKGLALQPQLEQILQCWIETITAGMDKAKQEQTFQCLSAVAEKAATLDITTIYPERKDWNDTK